MRSERAPEALFVLGRPDEADEVYGTLVETDPTAANIYAEWGNVYRRSRPLAGIPPRGARGRHLRSGP